MTAAEDEWEKLWGSGQFGLWDRAAVRTVGSFA